MRNRLPELWPHEASITTDVVIEPSLEDAAFALLKRIGFDDKNLLIVCDANTHQALGERIARELVPLQARILILDNNCHADERMVKYIRGHKVDALIAVGSGTISDLCKYASFLDGVPYTVFPTAPSMNGYLSANASITIQGVKESRNAHLPIAVFCDMGIIASAPIRLIQSGLGDSLCRPTAQADWLLSHLLLDTPYSPQPFDMLKPFESELFAHADGLVSEETNIIELLLKTLLVSGLGMTCAGGSYPASQGEHMIAHTMEMKHGENVPSSYHGEQIGITTLTMAKLQSDLLSRPLRLPSRPRWEDALVSYFGSIKAESIAEKAKKKYEIYDRFDVLASTLAIKEDEIREKIHAVSLPEVFLREVLLKARCHTAPSDLGLSDHDYDIAVSRARFTRDRFTFLDLL